MGGKGGLQIYVIDARNCVHCKICDIKDPNRNINREPAQRGPSIRIC